jgi:hypothetical protein
MTGPALTPAFNRGHGRIAIVLGTNEIASAAAVYLHRAGYGAVLVHAPVPPVIRRGMAFHDALYGEPASVDMITAVRADRAIDTLSVFCRHEHVAVTELGLCDLIILGPIDLLIDARMQKRVTPPDFRGLARMTIGLGPGFTVNVNCDAAIETRPAETGAVIRLGKTAPADGIPRVLSGAGRERFVYTGTAGNWRTGASIGMLVQEGGVLGHLDGMPVNAPLTGTLRGIARDGTWLPAAVKLLEIDARLEGARWTGMEPRARVIAEAVLDAAGIAVRRSLPSHHLSLVHSS